MFEVVARQPRVAPGTHFETVVAVSVAAAAVVLVVALGKAQSQAGLQVAGGLIGACACVLLGRVYPTAAILAATPLVMLGASADGGGGLAIGQLGLFIVILLAARVGMTASGLAGACCIALLAAGWQFADGLNPLIIVSVCGAWGVGRIMRARARLYDELAARGYALELEHELLAEQSIRLERARIARDLHDVIAHAVSMLTVQATAGERLLATEPRLAEEALDNIAASAAQAACEVERLASLLESDAEAAASSSGDLAPIAALLARTRANGLDVTWRVDDEAARLSAACADTAYRCIQEALTNAAKHAPGATVAATLTTHDGLLEIEVANGAPIDPGTGLDAVGGGRGIAGMRARIAAGGGTLALGPTADGGWRIEACLPCNA